VAVKSVPVFFPPDRSKSHYIARARGRFACSSRPRSANHAFTCIGTPRAPPIESKHPPRGLRTCCNPSSPTFCAIRLIPCPTRFAVWRPRALASQELWPPQPVAIRSRSASAPHEHRSAGKWENWPRTPGGSPRTTPLRCVRAPISARGFSMHQGVFAGPKS